MHFISVKFQLIGSLSWMTSEAETVLEVVSGSPLRDALAVLADYHGEDVEKAILGHSGQIFGGVSILIDQKAISHEECGRIKIEKPCVITLIPLAAGG
jgi:hypothetical protein